MGELIVLEAIAVIQGGLLQIDIRYENSGKGERFFVEPKDFFTKLGNAMNVNREKYELDYMASFENVSTPTGEEDKK